MSTDEPTSPIEEPTVELPRDEPLIEGAHDEGAHDEGAEPTMVDLPLSSSSADEGAPETLVVASAAGTPGGHAAPPPAPRAGPKPKSPARTVLATVMIVLASLLTPLAIVGGWAQVSLIDTEAFVATAAPLVREPLVREYLTDQVVLAIEDSMDIEEMIGGIVDGLAGVVKLPVVVDGLRSLEQSAIEGVRSAIRNATGRAVGSEVFADAWRESLRLSHGQAIAALRGDPDAALTVGNEGLGLRIGPLVAQAKAELIARGFDLANRIPAVDKTIVLVRSDSFEQAKQAYQLLVVVEGWLPFAIVALLVVGILTAVRRQVAGLWAAFGVGLGALLLVIGVPLGRAIASDSVPTAVVPTPVLQLAYDSLVSGLAELATVALSLAVVAVVALWLTGPFRGATSLRRAASSGRSSLQHWAGREGLSTGGFGLWLHRSRVWWRTAIAVVAVGALLAQRPLTVSEVFGTALAAVLVLLVLSLLERAPQASADD